jgi:ornithine cyclodeaminase
MLNQNLLLLNHHDVSELIDNMYEVLFNAIQNSYLLMNQQKAINPPSTLIWYDKPEKKRVIALPAFVGGSIKRPGLKWIASAPNNIKNNLPRASALLVLNDEATGFPVAILEASKISAVRTVLSAIVALEKLHVGKLIQNLGIIGCGYISTQFLIALKKLNWQVESIHIFDQDPDRIQAFQNKFPDQKFYASTTADEVIKQNDVIFLATTAIEPYIFDTSNLNKQIILNISLRDLAPELILGANNIVDHLEHILSSNTSVFLAYEKIKSTSFIQGSIAELILNQLELNSTKPTIFSPMGLGILDIVVGDSIYQAAEKEQYGLNIENFFNGHTS